MLVCSHFSISNVSLAKNMYTYMHIFFRCIHKPYMKVMPQLYFIWLAILCIWQVYFQLKYNNLSFHSLCVLHKYTWKQVPILQKGLWAHNKYLSKICVVLMWKNVLREHLTILNMRKQLKCHDLYNIVNWLDCHTIHESKIVFSTNLIKSSQTLCEMSPTSSSHYSFPILIQIPQNHNFVMW